MRKIIIFFIRLYKVCFSLPLKTVFGGGCRFYPTCSDYSAEAIHKYGVVRGGKLAIKRILKCHPWQDFSLDEV